MELTPNKIYLGDALDILATFPERSIDCCVTSPPYFGLRDYGVAGQLGLERMPEEYIGKLVAVFRQVHRVLKDNGTLWVVIGDNYNGSGKAGSNPDYMERHTSFGKLHNPHTYGRPVKVPGLKPKDLLGIPWRLAFALQQDGWWLRQDIIWHKTNPMPESVRDRCTKSHEYIFLLSKSAKYYFDAPAIADPVATCTVDKHLQDLEILQGSERAMGETSPKAKARPPQAKPRRNKRSVWIVATKPCREAHFATFPDMLIVDCIRAGCPVRGVVLDPFMGSGTTALAALKNNRHYKGIELNPDYVEIAQRRICELK